MCSSDLFPSHDTSRATSLTLPRKAVSVTLIMFCASRLNTIGKLTFQICLLVYIKSVCSLCKLKVCFTEKKERNIVSCSALLLLIRFGLAIHAHQKLIVISCLFQAVFYKIHSLNRVHIRQVFAQNPHAVKCLFIE